MSSKEIKGVIVKKPGLLYGALIGGVISLPLLGVIALGQAVAEFPFVPAYLFGFFRDIAPGSLVPQTIQVMSSIIIGLNLGRVDEVAKIAEEVMAIGLLIALCIVAGAVFFGVLNAALKKRSDTLPGIVFGLVVGIPVSLIVNQFPLLVQTTPVVTFIWVIGLSVLFGMALSYIYNTLRFVLVVPETPTPADKLSAEAIDRRQFLVRVGAGAAVVTVAGAGVSALLRRTTGDVVQVASGATPGLDPIVTPEITPDPTPGPGEFRPALGTRREITPLAEHYRIDINTFIPEIPEEGYTLPVTTRLTEDGSEQTLATLTLDGIRNDFEAVNEVITMSCISNRVGGDLISSLWWKGARMKDILATIELPEGARFLRITSADGFDEYVSIDLINNDERVLMCYEWDNQPLTPKHGFPLRIHIPNLYGMKQPKWITKIEVVTDDTGGYWVRRGWDARAEVRTVSVIDTVAVDEAVAGENGTFIVPVGGIAWSGDRGISAVEVSFDGAEWAQAEVKPALGGHAWSLWRVDLPIAAGNYTLQVRAREGDGTPQIEASAGTFPSGATGLHSQQAVIG
jgi:DMSO/TMAO reductase YedYZ molybdopterin-dependent catalytic subunit